MHKLWLLLLILLVPLAHAAPPWTYSPVYSEGLTIDALAFDTLKQGDNFELHVHVYNSTSGLNISSRSTCETHVYNSKGQHIIQAVLPYDGVDEFQYNISGNNFTQIGQYALEVWCYSGTSGGSERIYFEVTPSGNKVDEAQSSLIYLPSMLILALAAFFFGISFLFQKPAGKIIFVGLSAIMMVIAILFILVSMEQVIPTEPVIIDGLATLWFVIKIMTGIAMIILFVFAIVFAYWSWMGKKGYRD